MPAMFFFQRVCSRRLTLPGGLKVVLAPYGVEPESWMSVLAYDSLSYMRMSRLYACSVWAKPRTAFCSSAVNALAVPITSSRLLALRMAAYGSAQ